MRNKLFICVIFICALSCARIKQYNIGFVGSSSGVYTSPGIASRNGTMLAIDEFNRENSAKYNLSLICMDDEQNIKTANQSIDQLTHDYHVIGIIGPISNTVAMGIIDKINKTRTVTISPVCNIEYVKGMDDHFFTMNSSVALTAEETAKMILKDSSSDKPIVIFYHVKNSYFYSNFLDIIDHFLDTHQCTNYLKVPVEQNINNDYSEVTIKALKSNPQSALIVDNDINTALIAQNLKLLNPDIHLYGTEMALTDRTISNGGKAVEGMKFVTTIDFDPSKKEISEFLYMYNRKFGDMPDSFAYLSYLTTTTFLTACLACNFKTDQIKSELLKLRETNNTALLFNKYGDVEHSPIKLIIKKGSFDKINEKKN